MVDTYQVLLNTPFRRGANFQLSASSGADTIWADSFVGAEVEWLAELPITGTIVFVTVISKGNNHNTNGPPLIGSRVTLYRYDSLAGGPSVVDSYVDTSGTANIDTRHPWGIENISEEIGPRNFYSVKIKNEHGGLSQPGHEYHGISIGVVPPV